MSDDEANEISVKVIAMGRKWQRDRQNLDGALLTLRQIASGEIPDEQVRRYAKAALMAYGAQPSPPDPEPA